MHVRTYLGQTGTQTTPRYTAPHPVRPSVDTYTRPRRARSRVLNPHLGIHYYYFVAAAFFIFVDRSWPDALRCASLGPACGGRCVDGAGRAGRGRGLCARARVRALTSVGFSGLGWSFEQMRHDAMRCGLKTQTSLKLLACLLAAGMVRGAI
ncbi:uncharacterized protein K452DRAFT_48736 [Aplosporella prunicola CBS 121167]|uniref:Uncharacterized protein n=1 Tax=Aplosporella prunicola CBS 121167 TaxID=1176127 RepID=A0A6A6B8Y1_9PEZI|nr:uncharacterized protein K452DRAFT_48736 [Aplosporella prunicola CBS 121167]KAF2140600.1 hypothetical protein K452DRAFT_48736 [Aplosporella prunicola CBS 121167]